MRFFSNLAGVLLTSAVSLPVGMVTSILLARFLSTDDRGFYALALSFAALTTMLWQIGWPTASIYRLRRAGTRPAEVSGAALLFLGGVSVLGLAGAFVLEPVLRERFLGDLPKVAFVLALATVPARMLANGFGSIARGIDRFRDENWFAFLLAIGNLFVVAVVLVVFHGGLVELMAGIALVYFLLVPGFIGVVLRRTGLSFAVRPTEMTDSLRFGLKTYAMAVAGRLHERIDLFLLAALLDDPTEIAFYAIAKGMIQILQLLPTALGKVAYPQLAGLDPQSAADFAAGLVRQNLLLMVPVALILAPIAPIFLPLLYGEAYSASTSAFLLLLPGSVLLGAGVVMTRYFTGTNSHRPTIITRFVSLGVNVLLNYLWIPKWGIEGAAAAGLASYSVDAGLITVVFLARSGCRWRDLVVIRQTDLDPYRKLLRRFPRLRARGG
jgi:O-antigen/teichoic acid export membrane protein